MGAGGCVPLPEFEAGIHAMTVRGRAKASAEFDIVKPEVLTGLTGEVHIFLLYATLPILSV